MRHFDELKKIESNFMRLLVAFILAAFVSGCLEDEDERFDAGHSDGYAVGYNTECKIRATFIEGDFDSKGYSRGYNAGLLDGAKDCKKQRN